MTKRQKFKNQLTKKQLGIDIALPKLNAEIYGIQQGTYYLLGGGSGSGKTTLVDYAFLLSTLYSKRPCKIFYYSFEIPELRKTAKMISYQLYEKYGIELSNMDILNKTKKDITEYHDVIMEEYDIYEKLIGDRVVFRYTPTNPTQIYKDLDNYSKENGTYEYEYKEVDGKQIITNTTYIPNNPDELVLVIVDHLRRAKKERGFSKKENIDKISEYAVDFRNLCNYSFVLLQQFNRAISSVDRQKLKGEDLIPNDADFSETSESYQDCDIALSMFNTFKNGVTTFGGVKINKEHRILSILKNRDGEDNISFVVSFKGKVNHIRDIDYNTMKEI